MNKNMSVLSMAMLIFIATFGFTNIVNNYAVLGPSTVIWFSLLAIYFIIFALLMIELAVVQKDQTTGLNSWIELGTNKKIGFIGAWSYFIVNIFYIPMLASRIPVFLSWVFADYSTLDDVVSAQGQIPGVISAENSPILFVTVTIITLIIALIIAINFEQLFDKIGKPVGIISLVVSLLFIVMTLLSFLVLDPSQINHYQINDYAPKISFGMLSTLAWLIFAISGIETIGSYVKHAQKPEKSLPKAIIVATFLVTGLYIIGTIGLSLVLTPEQVPLAQFESLLAIIYAQAGAIYGLGPWFLRIIMLCYAIITISALVLWAVSTINVLFSDDKDEIFPKIITKKTKHNKAVNGYIFLGILTTLFIIIADSGPLSNLYTAMYNMSTMAVILPYILLLISYILFKIKSDNNKHNIFKSSLLSTVLAILLLIITVIAFIFAGFDFSLSKVDFIAWATIAFGGLLFFLGIGYSLYLVKINKKAALIYAIGVIIPALLGILLMPSFIIVAIIFWIIFEVINFKKI